MNFPQEVFKQDKTLVVRYSFVALNPSNPREAIYLRGFAQNPVKVHETQIEHYWLNRQEAIEDLIKQLENDIEYLKRQLD